MGDAHVGDLRTLDRDVARAWQTLTRWRTKLVHEPDAQNGVDPLEGLRHVAAKSTWDALTQLETNPVDALLRDALKRWVYALLQARLGRPDEVEWAREAAEKRGHFAGDPPRLVSWHEAWRGVVEAKHAAESGRWLDAAAEVAPALAAVRCTLSERRLEAARRLGVEHPWSPLVERAPGALRVAATQLLDATEDLSRSVWRETLRGEVGVAPVLHAAVARDAGQGWPARLTPRWLDEAFGMGTRGMPIDLAPLPPALGAASFARALQLFGHALHVATLRASMPFALAREPAFVAAHRLGFVFGALAADAEMHVRLLGLGRRTANAQARVLARTALLDARLHAVRLLLGDDAAPPARELHAELSERLFGRPLDARFYRAWPNARDDEPARFLALLESRVLGEGLRAHFDVDWFRNPRAWSHLRTSSAGPAPDAALDGGAARLANAFEKALG